LAQRYGVQGFPTIKFFPAGRKDGQGEDYDGGRTSSVCYLFFNLNKKKILFLFFFSSIGYCCLGNG
jgi:hypothetical protein